MRKRFSSGSRMPCSGRTSRRATSSCAGGGGRVGGGGGPSPPRSGGARGGAYGRLGRDRPPSERDREGHDSEVPGGQVSAAVPHDAHGGSPGGGVEPVRRGAREQGEPRREGCGIPRHRRRRRAGP